MDEAYFIATGEIDAYHQAMIAASKRRVSGDDYDTQDLAQSIFDDHDMVYA